MITKSKGCGSCGDKIHSDFGENAFDKINTRGNYRIATLEYNSLTSELTINQYPDVSKTIILGEGSVSRNNTTSHKDTVEKILDWANIGMGDLNNLNKDKNYIIYNANNPAGEKYLYYTYDKSKGEWNSSVLIEGDEFFNLEDSVKYRYNNNRILNATDVILSARNTVTGGVSTGITLEVSPTTGDSVHLDLVDDQYAGLMSPEDKLKLDNISSRIGSVLELGQSTNGVVPLYLKTSSGEVLSVVNLDEDDYIYNIEASIATEDNPDKGIHIGDRILTFTLTNGTKMVVSLEGWFLNYVGTKTNSIDLTIVKDVIQANLVLDPNPDNLSEVTTNGLLTSLNWENSTSKSVKFSKGTKANYSNVVYEGHIYFATDTKEVIVDGIAYGLDLLAPDLELISKIEGTATAGEFLITKSNGGTYNIRIPISNDSTNGLMSKGDKIKLDTIEGYAQINKLEGIKIGDASQTIINKVASLDTYTKAEINSKTDSGTHYRGTATSVGVIPTGNRQVGDIWKITSEKLGLATNASVYWDGSAWVTFTGTLNLSEYATKEDLSNQSGSTLNEVNKKLDTKVDKVAESSLVSNTEIEKLSYVGSYVNNITESIITGKINLGITKSDPASKGVETISQIILQEASNSHNGLMSAGHYDILESLQTNGTYLDKTGTPSPTWQLSKGNGPKIKDSGGEFGLRNRTDDDYTGLTVKNLTITGNVTQLGSSFISEAQTVEVVDNTILLNKNEPGAGITKGYAGLEIDRGTLPKYNIYFDESDDRFKAGQTGNEQPIMLRDDEVNLVGGNTLIWDTSTKLAKTGKNIDTELNKYLPLTGSITEGTRMKNGITWEQASYFHITKYVDGNTRRILEEGGGNIYLGNTEYHNIELRVPDGQPIHRSSPSGYYKIWDAGNDGEGSGLDADLLDGKHASKFALTTSIPTALKNPYAITFTGAVSETYDGSATKTVSIPAGLSLGESSTTAYRGDRGKIAYDYSQGTRTIAEISGLQTALNGKEPTFTKNTAFNKSFGTTTGTTCQGDDARLSNSRPASDVSAWAKAAAKPGYTAAEVGASASGHNHAGVYQPVGSYAASTHNHSKSQITDFPASLPASDVSAWAKAAAKPGYTAAEVGAVSSVGTRTVTDCNHFIQNGMFGFDNTPANGPGVPYISMLVVKNIETGYQLAGGYSSERLFFRGIVTNSVFTPWKELAFKNNIPTQTSQLTNNSGFITSSSLNGYATQYWVGSNCVTLGDTQTITGAKTFTSAVTGTLGFYDTSDARLKTNIKEIELKSEKINLYEFDKEGRHSYGVIAQEVEELYPSTVKENDGGYKVVNYNEILTIKCAELELANTNLRDRLNKLENLLFEKGLL